MRFRTPSLVLLTLTLVAACDARVTDLSDQTTSSSTTTGSGGGTTGAGGAGGMGDGGQASSLPGGISVIDGVESSLPTGDLKVFGEIAGATPVVGLGASVEISGGFMAMRVRLARYLIEEKGFRVLTINTPRTEAEKLGAYLATCNGDATDALTGVMEIFVSEDTLSLVNWLCQFNQAHPDDRVSFHGIDGNQPWHDSLAIQAFLAQTAPADAPALEAGIAVCDGVGYSSDTEYYLAGADLTPFPQAALDACGKGLSDLDAYFDANASTLETNSSKEELEWARIAVVGLRAWQFRRFYFDTDFKKGFEATEAAKAEIFERTRALAFPDAKAILWADNVRLAHHHDLVDKPGLGKAVTMGTLLRQHLGEGYQAFGFVGYDVMFKSAFGDEQPSEIPTDPASLELALHGLGHPHLFVDLNSPALSGFITPGQSYSVGTPKPSMLVPVDQFRALFFFDHSPPMQSLFD